MEDYETGMYIPDPLFIQFDDIPAGRDVVEAIERGEGLGYIGDYAETQGEEV